MDGQRAANVATVGFVGLAAVQAALAAGAPLGAAAWGGSHTYATTGQRIGSAISVVFYVAAIVVVQRRAAGRGERHYRWGGWALVVVLAASGSLNVASTSPWERYLLAPLALPLAAATVAVARSPVQAGSRDAPPRM